MNEVIEVERGKILHLNLKKKWFDMIASGEKKEEYREIKPYWINRLLGKFSWDENIYSIKWNADRKVHNKGSFQPKTFDEIIFKNGYSKTSPMLNIDFIQTRIGIGREEWGAPKDKEVFIISLGKILNQNKDK